MLGVTFLELFDPSGCIDKFLLSGKEGVTLRTDLNFYLFINGPKFKLVATGADGRNFVIFRMYIGFHFFADSFDDFCFYLFEQCSILN